MTAETLKAGLALATELHEAGRVTYRDYLTLHKAMSARHAGGAEHTITIEWDGSGDEPTWTLSCHAGPDADCKVDEDGELYGDGCDVVADYEYADTLIHAIDSGRVTFPVIPEWYEHWHLTLVDEHDAALSPAGDE